MSAAPHAAGAGLDPLERLLAEKACRDIVLAAARAVDAQDYQALAALFAPEGELVRPGGSPLRGPQAVFDSYAAKDPERLTQHLVTNHEVEVTSATTARSYCRVILWSSRRGETLTPRGRRADAIEQVGEIEDEFVRTPEGWRIARRAARFTMFREPA